MGDIIAKFTDFGTKSNWVLGTVGELKFKAKLFDTGSMFGIEGGRVSKLWISDSYELCVASYDRGWDIKPPMEYQEHYEVVMELLENSPKRFNK